MKILSVLILDSSKPFWIAHQLNLVHIPSRKVLVASFNSLINPKQTLNLENAVTSWYIRAKWHTMDTKVAESYSMSSTSMSSKACSQKSTIFSCHHHSTVKPSHGYMRKLKTTLRASYSMIPSAQSQILNSYPCSRISLIWPFYCRAQVSNIWPLYQRFAQLPSWLYPQLICIDEEISIARKIQTTGQSL